MKVLVLGAGGLLGSALVREILEGGNSVVGTYHSAEPAFDIPLEKHDLRQTEKFRLLLTKYEPDVIVNCAAMTDVDLCESNPNTAFEVNGDAPGELASICSSRDKQFVHVSTDYVFDGQSETPYDETAKPNPIQIYGKSKLAGEKNVLKADTDAIVARLSFVYGVRGDTEELVGFPSWVSENLRENDSVPLFVDQQITPTRAGQASQIILELIRETVGGLYHVASCSCVTPFEFGKKIAQLTDADEDLLQKSQQRDLSREAARPSNTCLDVTKVEEELGSIQPTLQEDLQSIKPYLTT